MMYFSHEYDAQKRRIGLKRRAKQTRKVFDAALMKRLHSEGMSFAALGRRFGVQARTISKLIKQGE